MKQEIDSQKLLRVMEKCSRKSQRVKTRSAVSKQIVDDNKKERDSLRSAEIKEHLQHLKFKIQKTELIRSKNAEKREERLRSLNQSNLKDGKKAADQEEVKAKKSRVEEKHRTAEVRQEHLELVRKEAQVFNQMVRTIKSDNARKVDLGRGR
jgi:hypothetical protein